MSGLIVITNAFYVTEEPEWNRDRIFKWDDT